ncbi:T9SS type A sorting domain-containing protein [Psychroserpens sp.]
MIVYNDELYFGAGNLYKYLDPTLSNDEFIETQSFKLYPNPTSSHFSIKSNLKIKNIEIYDILGKQVKVFTQTQELYNISELSNGLYFIIFFTENKYQTIKLIKN